MAQESEVYVPAYDVSKQMNYKQVAEQIDAHLREKYEGQKVVIRSLSASEHEEPLDDIIERIKSTGSERNEPERQGREHEQARMDEKAKYDFVGAYHEIHKSSNMMEPAIKKYYEKPKEHGLPPMKVDLILVYEAEHLEKVPYEDKGSDLHDAYKFKNPENKQAALKGIIKIKSDGDSSQKPTQGSPAKPEGKPEAKEEPSEEGESSEEAESSGEEHSE